MIDIMLLVNSIWDDLPKFVCDLFSKKYSTELAFISEVYLKYKNFYFNMGLNHVFVAIW